MLTTLAEGRGHDDDEAKETKGPEVTCKLTVPDVHNVLRNQPWQHHTDDMTPTDKLVTAAAEQANILSQMAGNCAVDKTCTHRITTPLRIAVVLRQASTGGFRSRVPRPSAPGRCAGSGPRGGCRAASAAACPRRPLPPPLRRVRIVEGRWSPTWALVATEGCRPRAGSYPCVFAFLFCFIRVYNWRRAICFRQFILMRG